MSLGGHTKRCPVTKVARGGHFFFCFLAACAAAWTAVSATPRLCSSAMWLVGGSATQARKMFSMQQRPPLPAAGSGAPRPLARLDEPGEQRRGLLRPEGGGRLGVGVGVGVGCQA